jgi:hypothetical protein
MDNRCKSCLGVLVYDVVEVDSVWLTSIPRCLWSDIKIDDWAYFGSHEEKTFLFIHGTINSQSSHSVIA